MKVTVVSIEREKDRLTQTPLDVYKIVVLLERISYEFQFTVNRTKIGDREIVTFVEDAAFSECFKFNTHIAIEITNLVRQAYQGNAINLPVYVGDFVTPEQALAQRKGFELEISS